MARKKQASTETESEPEKKPKPGKKREPVKSSGPATKPVPVKKAATKKRSRPQKKTEPPTKPEPVQAIEWEHPSEQARTFSVHRHVAQQPTPEVSQNLMAGAGLCTFVGSVLFSVAMSSGLSKAMSLLAIVAAAIGLGGYLQLFLIVKRARISVLLREHYFAWFALVTVIISSIIFGIQLVDFVRLRSRPAGTFTQAGPTPTPVEDKSTRVLPDGRVLMVDITPESLSNISREHDSVEAEKLMKPYWRKWIRLDGVVKDVDNKSESGAASASLLIQGPSLVSVTYFSDTNQIERLGKLKKRDPVRVLCQITRRYTAGDYSFEKCELAD